SGAPSGSEFRVNSTTTGFQVMPHVASAPSGSFLVVWEGTAAGVTSLFAQLYGSTGAPTGGEVRVNTYTSGRSYQARVAASSTGFIVVWTNTTEDGSQAGVYAQRYDLSGARVGGEFLVASATLKTQYEPSVAFDSSGGFVVVWTAYQPSIPVQIHSQRFDAS